MDSSLISKKYNISQIVVDLLKSRGIDSEEKLKEFIFPTDISFYDPFLLSGMDKLCERIKTAIRNDEKVLIFGDYDVDGISATAILIKYFESIDFYVDHYIPIRNKDGYGLSKDVILRLKQKFSPTLIITVDCGISSCEEVEFAKTLGIDIVITDHHSVQGKLPSTIIVDPYIKGQKYPFKFLCGAGVALKVIEALSNIEEMRKYLGIVAIATIADVVPLTSENRAIVKLGMRDFDKNLPKGIKILLDSYNKKDISSRDIAFKLSPIINVAGRMGNPELALKLYTKSSESLLRNIACNLKAMNDRRKDMCDKIYDDAKEKLSKVNLSSTYIIIMSGKATGNTTRVKWDSSFLGIVASRIAEEFRRPTILLGEYDDILKGSARSVNGKDIFDVISKCSKLLESFGGHKTVAGLTLKKENLKPFISKLQKLVSKTYTFLDFIKDTKFDYEIKGGDIDRKLIQDLKLLEPYGQGNEEPIFSISLSNDAVISTIPRHFEHIKINDGNLSIVAFNAHKYLCLFKKSIDRKALVRLEEYPFRGKVYINEIAKDILAGKVILSKEDDDILSGAYLKQYMYGKTSCSRKCIKYKESDLEKIIKPMLKDPFGTLFVTFSRKSYDKLCKMANVLKYYIFEVISNDGRNGVVVAPLNTKNFGAYKNIVFLDTPPREYIKYVLENIKGRVYIKDQKENDFNLDFTRSTFGKYFRLISTVVGRLFYNEFELYSSLLRSNVSINFTQLIFSLYVFIELKIFSIETVGCGMVIRENKNVESSLSKSRIYTKMLKILEDKNQRLDKKNVKE